MSCTVCHYITGHDPDCRHYHEDHQREQDDLRTRIDDLETRIDQLEKSVLDYAHLKKLYGESRDYVRTLEGERDDLVEASKRGVAAQDRLDAEVERLRGVQVAFCRSNECNIRKRCTSAMPEYCKSLATMGLDAEAWDVAMHNIGELRTERDSLARELERWKHGKQIEGDYVCPSDLERDAYRAALADLLAATNDGVENSPTTYYRGKARDLLKNGPAIDAKDLTNA